jgi:hypothetical protein
MRNSATPERPVAAAGIAIDLGFLVGATWQCWGSP